MVRSGGWPGHLLVLVLASALAVVGAPASGMADTLPLRPARPVPAAPEVVPVGTWPLDPRPEVVGAFDPPDSPWGAGHRGVDLLGSLGQPVRAALPGRISFAAGLAGRGVVVVDHGSTRTTYEPVSPAVRVGDRVAAGQRLGRLTSPGSHCFPRLCLHWGWRRGDDYLNPLDLVGGGPVRLLPVWGSSPAEATVPAAPVGSPYSSWRPPAATMPARGDYLP